jgi:hypothetical protein
MTDTAETAETTETERAKLNLETAQVAWAELQRFFARGSVIWVDESLDMIDVAHCIVQDDSRSIKNWMDKKLVAQVQDKQAKRWLSDDTWLWSVVIRPLILVQELTDSRS